MVFKYVYLEYILSKSKVIQITALLLTRCEKSKTGLWSLLYSLSQNFPRHALSPGVDIVELITYMKYQTVSKISKHRLSSDQGRAVDKGIQNGHISPSPLNTNSKTVPHQCQGIKANEVYIGVSIIILIF